ncbi:MAG: FecR domain-containing protein [Spirosomataceae bacterium]
MNYIEFTTEDFVLDDYFRKWVNGQLPQEDDFWENWLAEYPEKMEMIRQAEFVLKALEMEHTPIDEKRVSEKIQQILQLTEPVIWRDKPTFFQNNWLKIAASVACIGLLMWYFLQTRSQLPTKYEQLITAQAAQSIEKINNTNEPLKVSLSDGSVITLQPKSRLSFPSTFALDKREVFLSGEALFDIAKDVHKPFLVYANELVTKVLGTSFSIRAFEKDQSVVVRVFTGRVSVLSGKGGTQQINQPFNQNEGVILTPNQMVVFDRLPERLTKTLVENPRILSVDDELPLQNTSFNFDNTPIEQVFETLEKSYGVKIVYDMEVLKNCTVTAPLGEESLYDKLNLICKVIRANYEVVDAQIVISSRGCS